MTEESLHNKIEDYLTGQLSGKEKVSFEALIQNDEALARAVELQRLEHDAMDRILEVDLKSKMANWSQTPPPNPFDNNNSTKEIPPNKKKTWWPFVVLLGVGLLGLVFYIFNPIKKETTPDKTITTPGDERNIEQEFNPKEDLPKEEESVQETKEEKSKGPFAKNTPTKEKPENDGKKTTIPQQKENNYRLMAINEYKVENNFSTTLKSGNEEPTGKSDFEKAAEAFDQKRYSEADQLIGAPTNADESTIRYLRGHIYFKLEKYSKAIIEFEAVSENEFAPNYQEAQWYLLLSYLAQLPERKADFEALGAKLVADEYASYRENAQLLMDKVVKMN